MPNLVMYDAITKFVNLMPTDGDIYAGYDDGSFNDVSEIVARFPNSPVLSIDVTGAHAAQALDVENGDATVADIDPWLTNFALTGPVFNMPVIYMSANLARSAFPTAHPNGCLLWSAHYTGQTGHICGPNSCGLLPYDADMTQWKSVTDFDQSAVNPAHFIWKGNTVTTPPPVVNHIQENFRFCFKCSCLVLLDFGANVCAAGGQHNIGNSNNYVMVYHA